MDNQFTLWIRLEDKTTPFRRGRDCSRQPEHSRDSFEFKAKHSMLIQMISNSDSPNYDGGNGDSSKPLRRGILLRDLRQLTPRLLSSVTHSLIIPVSQSVSISLLHSTSRPLSAPIVVTSWNSPRKYILKYAIRIISLYGGHMVLRSLKLL